MRKLVACLACRNQGTRLYGKPLQNLDIQERVNVLEYMIASVKTYPEVSAIVLGISVGTDNLVYQEIAQKNGIDFIIGDEKDVLQRLIQCCEKGNGTDIFHLTTESPFTFFELMAECWKSHVENDNDLTALDNLPVGSGFEMIKLEAYKQSWEKGEAKHRSELCTLYIREHKADFKIELAKIPQEIRRPDIRLTIDYPEDLILCRAVYKEFKHLAPRIPVGEIIRFLDANPNLKKLVDPYVAATLKTQYL